jgi:hypothetical protein
MGRCPVRLHKQLRPCQLNACEPAAICFRMRSCMQCEAYRPSNLHQPEWAPFTSMDHQLIIIFLLLYISITFTYLYCCPGGAASRNAILKPKSRMPRQYLTPITAGTHQCKKGANGMGRCHALLPMWPLVWLASKSTPKTEHILNL